MVVGDQAVSDIVENSADKNYRFSASTGRIERISDDAEVSEGLLEPLFSAARASGVIPIFSLTLGLIMSAASYVARRRSLLP